VILSTVIIIGGGGHNSITRLSVAGCTGQLTEAQLERFQELVTALEALAHEVSPQ
jgi:hypothetical protein